MVQRQTRNIGRSLGRSYLLKTSFNLKRLWLNETKKWKRSRLVWCLSKRRIDLRGFSEKNRHKKKMRKKKKLMIQWSLHFNLARRKLSRTRWWLKWTLQLDFRWHSKWVRKEHLDTNQDRPGPQTKKKKKPWGKQSHSLSKSQKETKKKRHFRKSWSWARRISKWKWI